MFYVGAAFGIAITYLVYEIRSALKGDPHDKIYRCTLEAARQAALHDLDGITDDQLISAIANGLDVNTITKK